MIDDRRPARLQLFPRGDARTVAVASSKKRILLEPAPVRRPLVEVALAHLRAGNRTKAASRTSARLIIARQPIVGWPYACAQVAAMQVAKFEHSRFSDAGPAPGVARREVEAKPLTPAEPARRRARDDHAPAGIVKRDAQRVGPGRSGEHDRDVS